MFCNQKAQVGSLGNNNKEKKSAREQSTFK